MSYQENTHLLELASELLEEFAEDIVYVGGITTFLYVDVNTAEEIRPTRDVDFIVPVKKSKDYDSFQKKLRQKGFTHDQTQGAPICRFNYQDKLIVDAMPTDESILGFSNSWYQEGMAHREKVVLGKRSIYVFSLPYFLASKFEAFLARGKHDPRHSHDLEDIVIVLDGISNFSSLSTSGRLNEFLLVMKKQCLEDRMQEAMAGFLSNNSEKLKRLNERIEALA